MSTKMDTATTWKLIHAERASMAETLAGLTPEEWQLRSLCGTWSVHVAAAHIVAGAEQTRGAFMKGMLTNGFRFNRMIARDADRVAAAPNADLVRRLEATTTTTNRPPAPVVTMLGEIVVHSLDVRQPVGCATSPSDAALVACLDMYKGANFPVGTKGRIAGLRLAPSDLAWTHGDGPEVTGPASSLLLAITGRPGGLDALGGEGAALLRDRMSAPAKASAAR